MNIPNDENPSVPAGPSSVSGDGHPAGVHLDWEPSSFRDPGGAIFRKDGRVYRAIYHRSLKDWSDFSASPLFHQLQQERLLIPTHSVDMDSRFPPDITSAWAAIVEHERIPFVSYPYEWSFGMLRDAALLQLDILERCLSHDLILKDSSSFNVQFIGSDPTFIDVLSFSRLEPGEPWIGYNQFCKMFLFPLMLQSYKQIPFQSWLRSELEGLDALTFSRLMSVRDLVRRGVFTHVCLQAWLQKESRRCAHQRAQQNQDGRSIQERDCPQYPRVAPSAAKFASGESKNPRGWITTRPTATATLTCSRKRTSFVKPLRASSPTWCGIWVRTPAISAAWPANTLSTWSQWTPTPRLSNASITD